MYASSGGAHAGGFITRGSHRVKKQYLLDEALNLVWDPFSPDAFHIVDRFLGEVPDLFKVSIFICLADVLVAQYGIRGICIDSRRDTRYR